MKINEDEIKESLKRSGYFLETRVLGILSSKGYSNYPNRTYPDGNTGRSREIDIYSESFRVMENLELNHWLHIELWNRLIIECVNNPQPAVFFKRPDNNPTTIYGKFLYTKTETSVKDSKDGGPDYAFNEYTVSSKEFHYNKFQANTQYCSFSQKKTKAEEWMASHPDALHDTFNKLFDCAHHVQQGHSEWIKKSAWRNDVFAILKYPVLILQGDLFEAEEKEDKIVLEKKKHVVFEFNRYSEYEKSILIDVVTEDYIEEYIDLIIKDINGLKNAYIEYYQEKEIIKEKFVPNTGAKESAKEKATYNQEEFEKLVRNFINGFEFIFDIDWEHTNSCLRDDWINHFISPDGTFIHHGIEDEGNNWGNRPALLNAYRQLDTYMRENKINRNIFYVEDEEE